jgi:hypothetical protein
MKIELLWLKVHPVKNIFAIGLICYGIWLLSPSAGFIAAGVAALVLPWADPPAKARKQ